MKIFFGKFSVIWEIVFLKVILTKESQVLDRRSNNLYDYLLCQITLEKLTQYTKYTTFWVDSLATHGMYFLYFAAFICCFMTSYRNALILAAVLMINNKGNQLISLKTQSKLLEGTLNLANVFNLWK